MFMSLRRVLMSEVGVLLGFLVIALFMVIGRGVMGLGCVLVMFGCLAMCFVCHTAPLVLGMIPGGEIPPLTGLLTAQADEIAKKSTGSTSRLPRDCEPKTQFNPERVLDLKVEIGVHPRSEGHRIWAIYSGGNRPKCASLPGRGIAGSVPQAPK
jgi:hypothetical protein